MSEKLKHIYDLITPHVDVIGSTLVDSEIKMNWIPIIQCGESWRSIGIIESGHWAVEVATGLVILNEPQTFLYTIVLLEKPITMVNSEIKTFFQSHDVSVDVDDLFPFLEIIRFTFEYEQSEYWIRLAFNWYDELPVFTKSMLKENLEKMAEKSIPQKLRHKARKELKRFKEM